MTTADRTLRYLAFELTNRELDPPPVTPTIAELYAQTAENVSVVSALAGDVTDLHGSAITNHAAATSLRLDERAQLVGRAPVPTLLNDLAEAGLSWRQIALLAGVSVPAIRKWRQGGASTGANRLRVARLVVLLHWLSADMLIDDPASWLEMPLVPGVPVSRLDLLADGHEASLISSLVGPETPPESVLDQYDPAWRTTYQSDYEVFTADDGQPSIRSKPDRR
mgnify:CR=1 FL=1